MTEKEITKALKGFSERDLKIVDLRSKGYKPSEVGEKLNIATRTVENRILLMRQAVEATSIEHLVRICMDRKLLSGLNLDVKGKELDSAL